MDKIITFDDKEISIQDYINKEVYYDNQNTLQKVVNTGLKP